MEKLELDLKNASTIRKTLIRTEGHNADLNKTFVDMFTFVILLIHVWTEKPQFERKNSSWIGKTRLSSKKP